MFFSIGAGIVAARMFQLGRQHASKWNVKAHHGGAMVRGQNEQSTRQVIVCQYALLAKFVEADLLHQCISDLSSSLEGRRRGSSAKNIHPNIWAPSDTHPPILLEVSIRYGKAVHGKSVDFHRMGRTYVLGS